MKNQTLIKTALELRNLGKTYNQIAAELKRSGFVNKSGRPYTGGGIATILLGKNLAPRVNVKKIKTRSVKSSFDSKEVINKILISKDFSLDEKLFIIDILR